MKISNNALNFLLAQYRAIFKRAYVKGIASAVLLTAGLAAGQAQADALASGAAAWDKVTNENSVTIADQVTASTPKKGSQYFQNITVKSGGTFNNSGAETQLVVKGTFTNEGTVNLNQGKTWGIVGYKINNDANQTLDTSEVAGTFDNKAKATLNISGSQLQVKNVILRNDSTTNISGSMGTKWWDEAMIVADNLQIESGATVAMSGGQLVTGRGGTMNIAGTLTMTGNAFLRATDNYTDNGEIGDPNSSAGKIVIANTADITVSDGASGGIFANDVEVAGKITLESGADFNLGGDLSYSSDNGVADAADNVASTNIKVVGGTITVNSGATVAIGGTNKLNGEEVTSTLVVESGTLENNSENVTLSANLQVADSADAKFIGSGTYTLEDTGALTMSSEKMAAFVETGKVDASTGTLTFTDAVDLSKLEIFGSDKINIGANTVLAGDNVTATGAIQGITGYAASFEDDDVKLGSNTYDGNLNLAKVIAHNTLDVQGKNDQFLVKGTELKLDRPYYQLDENDEFVLDACGNKLENGTGRVTGDKLILAADGTIGSSGLTAKHGHWVVDNDIVVSGGEITADTTQTSTLTAQSDNPAYLELTGDLELVDTNTANKQHSFINAKGTGATVDVSGVGNLTLNNTTRKRIQAYQGGTIVFKGSQVEDILSANTANDNGAKSVLFALNSGTLAITDSLDLNFAKLKSTNTDSGSYIAFLKGNSTIDVAGTLTLTTGEKQKNTSTALNIGDNKLQAQSLVLENLDQTKSGDVWVNEEKVEVESGTLVALSNLTVRNDNLVLGSGSNSGALILGDSTLASPYDATGTVSAKKITLDKGSSVTSYGNWTQAGGEIDVTNGKFDVYGSYTGDKLTIAGTSANASFNGVEDGQVSSFTKVTAAGTDSLQVKAGTLRIEGVEVKGEGSAANTTDPWGVNLANGAVKVDAGATLAFGNVASDHAFTVASDVVTLGTGFGTINLAGGTVELNFQDSFQNGLSAASLVDLKKKWFGSTDVNGALNGWLDIGDTAISDLSSILTPSEDGTYYTATQAEYAPIVDVLASVKNEQVENLLLTEVKENVKGVYGALRSDANQTSITIDDDTVLSNAGINGGNFATVGNTSELATLKVTGAELNLDSTKSAGTVGTVDLDGSSTLLLTGDKDITVAEITGSGYISAHTDTTVNAGVKGSSLYTYANVVVAGDVDLSGTDSSGKDDAGIFNHYEGVNGGTLLVASTNTDGSVTYHDVDTRGGANFEGGFLEAQNITLGADSYFVGDALLKAHGKLTLEGDLYLGQASDDTCPSKAVEGSAGFMDVFELDLHSNALILDPDYDQHASVGAAQYFTGRNSTNEFDGGIANGDILIGQNSAFGIGATLAETQAALDSLKLTDSTGALTNGTGAVLYVNRGFTVSDDNKIVLDSTATRSELTSPQHEANKTANNYSAYLEADSGIVMTDNAFGKDMKATAITFEANEAQVYADTGSKIILAGQRFTTNQKLNLLNDADNNGVDIVGENPNGSGTIRVQTENGLLVYDLTGKNQGAGITLGLNNNARSILSRGLRSHP